MKRKTLWLLWVACGLMACATYSWVQQGKTEAQAELDHQECHKTSTDARQCMEQKGYTLMKK